MEWISDTNQILALPEIRKKYFKHLQHNREKIEKVMKNRRILEYLEINEWTFEMFGHELKKRNPSFGYNRVKLMSRSETVQVIVDWLFHNFHEKWMDVFMEFVGTFNRDFGKRNSICLEGPPGCGKTWFLEMFCKIAMFVGRPTNWSRGDLFCLDNCIASRILLFDEVKFPASAPEYIENMKLILAGSPALIKCKHRDMQLIQNTPVFLACNTDPFQLCTNQRAYFVNERMSYYYVYPMPDFDKKTNKLWGHPLALFDVYDMVKEKYTSQTYRMYRD